MIEIIKSQEVEAPPEKVWKLIADPDDEKRYWPDLKNVKILSRKENVVEREATIRRGPMGEAKSLQTLVVNPELKSSILTMTSGPMLGTRKIELSLVGVGRTKIDVNWEFQMKGVPGFALRFIKQNISDSTDKALSEIAKDAEALRKFGKLN